MPKGVCSGSDFPSKNVLHYVLPHPRAFKPFSPFLLAESYLSLSLVQISHRGPLPESCPAGSVALQLSTAETPLRHPTGRCERAHISASFCRQPGVRVRTPDTASSMQLITVSLEKLGETQRRQGRPAGSDLDRGAQGTGQRGRPALWLAPIINQMASDHSVAVPRDGPGLELWLVKGLRTGHVLQAGTDTVAEKVSPCCPWRTVAHLHQLAVRQAKTAHAKLLGTEAAGSPAHRSPLPGQAQAWMSAHAQRRQHKGPVSRFNLMEGLRGSTWEAQRLSARLKS